MKDRPDMSVLSSDHHENSPTRLRTHKHNASRFSPYSSNVYLVNDFRTLKIKQTSFSSCFCHLIILMLMNNNSVFLMFFQVWWMALILQTRTEHVCPLQVGLYSAKDLQTGSHSPPIISGTAPLSASVCVENRPLLVKFVSHQLVNSNAFEGRRVKVERWNTNPIF